MHRIWLDTACTVYARVSAEDYAWAVQWRWQITWDRHKRKMYATRTVYVPGELSASGKRKRRKLYLHKEVLNRMDVEQPTEGHTMGDHGDGDSLNCERWNLSWATPAMNRATARSAARGCAPPEPVPDLPF